MSLINESAPSDFFDLHWEDVRACLPGFTTPATARAWVAYDLQGLHDRAHARVLSFAYPTTDGERTETIFVKRITDPLRAEADKFRWLETQGLPTPRLLAAIPGGDGEIVLLEHLRRIGIEPDEADPLLDLTARLNTTPDRTGDLFEPRPGLASSDFEALVVDALQQLVPDAAAWLETYRRASDHVGALPVALNHGELYFQQVGWAERDDGEQLVLFDLDTMALLPYLTDVAGILRPLADRTGRSEAELFARYLEALEARGRPCEPNRAWTDLRWTRVVRIIESLPWRLEMNHDPEGTESVVELINIASEDATSLGL